jgi:hypothetical protein
MKITSLAFIALMVIFLQGCSTTLYVAQIDNPKTIEQWAEQAFPKSTFIEEDFSFTNVMAASPEYFYTESLDKRGYTFEYNERSLQEITDSFSQYCNQSNFKYSVHHGELHEKEFLICAPVDWETPSEKELQDYQIGYPFVMLKIRFNYRSEDYLDIFVVSHSKAKQLMAFNQYDKVDNGTYAQGSIDYIANSQSYGNMISAFVDSDRANMYGVGRQAALMVKAYDINGDYKAIPLRFIHSIERSDYGKSLTGLKLNTGNSDITWNIQYTNPTSTGNRLTINASTIEFVRITGGSYGKKRDMLLIPYSRFGYQLDKVWYYSPLGDKGGVGYFNTSNLLSLTLNWHDYKGEELTALEIRKAYSKKYVDLVEALKEK